MVLKAEQDRIRALLKDTITLLCRNGLTFKTEFSIEALIGITLDQDDVMLVSINELIRTELGTKMAAAQASSEAADGQEDNYEDYSDASQGHSPSSPGSSAKRRRKRRRSSGQASKAADDEDSGGGSSEEADENHEPPSKRITAKMKNAVKQEDDEDSKDIVFIKEEVDHGDWQSNQTQSHQGNSYHHQQDLSGIPSTSSSSLQQQQDNFDFLQGNTLIPMGSASQSGGAGLWPDMSQQSHQQQQQQQHLGQNMTSPASKRTSTVTSNMPTTPSGDDSQQIQIGSTDVTFKSSDRHVDLGPEKPEWETDVKLEAEDPYIGTTSTDTLSSIRMVDDVKIDEDDCSSNSVPTSSQVEEFIKDVDVNPVMPPPVSAPITKASGGKKKASKSNVSKVVTQTGLTIDGQPGKVCPVCGKVLTSPRGFKLHVDKHNGIFPLHCQFCNRGFLSSSALQGHLVTHTKVKEFKCLYCEKEFKYRNGLDYHQAFCQARYNLDS